MTTVRTRFAPSPTGPLHIGGLRSALFGWLLARHHGGQFILRIEDTDQKRFVPGSIEMIYDGLSWLGLDWDEGPDKGGPCGPYVQSQRLEHYQHWANWLVGQGRAYKCFATPEELEQANEERRKRGLPPGYDRRYRDISPEEVARLEAAGRSYVIRLKIPLEGSTKAVDLVQGAVEFDNNQLQDAVLLKSDGFPTYHLAHVVDDHLMQISHVTRANEWLPSLPLHIQLWQAFGWPVPQYAHLPVLLNPNGKGKLSKRHAGFSEDGRQVPVLASEFKEAGYLPQAVANFLANIGWNFGDDREVFSMAEAIERFDIGSVNPTNSAYPIEKLEWLNGVYIREHLTPAQLAQHLRKPLQEAGLVVDDEERLVQVAELVQTRIKTLNEVVGLAGFFFRDYADFRAPAPDILIQKKMDAERTRAALQAALQMLESESDFSHESLHARAQSLAQELGLSNSQLFGTLRVAVTGQQISTPTFETMTILGKTETLRRLRLAVEALS